MEHIIALFTLSLGLLAIGWGLWGSFAKWEVPTQPKGATHGQLRPSDPACAEQAE